MDGPPECRYCGCTDTIAIHSDSVTFACQTYWGDYNGGVWVQRSDTCGSQVGDLYRRIRQALERLKSVERYDTDEVDPDTWCGDQVAQAVDAENVDEVIRILEGVDNDETE